MNDAFRNGDWERRLRPFERVWERVQQERPAPPPPPGPPPKPPMYGPPPPKPKPPLRPGCGNCSRAVRFNPHGRR